MNHNVETKEAYSARIEAQIDQINAQIDEMLAKTTQAKSEMAFEYHERMDALCRQRDTMKEQLRSLKASTVVVPGLNCETA